MQLIITQMIRHVLFVKFKDQVTSKEVLDALATFEQIPTKIKGIIGFEWGENTSSEGLNDDFTHCIQLVFEDEKARQNYLPHPEHLEIKNLLFKIIEKIVVLDYSF